MRTYTAATLRHAIHAVRPDMAVDVEMTGGGVATLSIGPVRPDAAGDGRSWLLAGPGSYDWSDPWSSIFYAADLNVGPDDDGLTDAYTCRTPADLAAYVAAHCECHGCPSVNTYHAGWCAYCIEACSAAAGHTPYSAED